MRSPPTSCAYDHHPLQTPDELPVPPAETEPRGERCSASPPVLMRAARHQSSAALKSCSRKMLYRKKIQPRAFRFFLPRSRGFAQTSDMCAPLFFFLSSEQA